MSHPCIDEIRNLVGKAKLERAINKFVECAANDPELSSTAILLSGRFHAMQRQHNMGLLAASEFNMQTNRIIHSLLGAIEGMGNSGGQTPPVITPPSTQPSMTPQAPPPSGEPKVFISYNHGDQAVAIDLKTTLEAAEIIVTMDVDNLGIGQRIATYTEEAVRNTDITVSIVSERSLLSSWVASETLLTFMAERVLGQNKFFACYLDKEFLDPGFLVRMIDSIDEQIGIRKVNRNALMERNVDAQNLTTEISRLTELRNSAGTILNRLISSNTLDLTEKSYEKNVPRLIEAIKKVAQSS